MNVTIKDIAKRSGVGISTVSRVLNGSGSASKETKERVMRVVRELNYVPNNNARNLKKGSSKSIIIFVKDIENPFFQKLIHEVENLILLRGYSIDIRNVGLFGDEMSIAMKEVKTSNLCGIILMGGCFGYTNENFHNLGVPSVLLTIGASESVFPELYSSVLIDDVLEMKKVTEYLIHLGHRRIGCIYNNYASNATPNSLRLQGYRQALEDAGISFDPELVSSGTDFWGSGYEFGFNMMKLLMEKNPDMTAVVAIADIMAIGAAKAALTMERRIPEDISIIGFDGIEAAEYYNPALDTVAQPAQQMAQHAVDALMEMLNGGKTSHIVLESNLIRRGSSAKVR